MAKKVSILGSTGSIGTQTLNVISELEGQFEVVALAAGSNSTLLAEQIEKFQPSLVSVSDPIVAKELQKRFVSQKIICGEEGLVACAAESGADIVMSAVSGAAGMLPTLRALEAGIDVALSNKETLVAGGELITNTAKRTGARLIPVDSEHSALFQCLQGEDSKNIHRLILTASGGPFRTFTQQQLEEVTLEQALAHPTWTMGAKVTIDSSTLMNKGLELIEAYWLFDVAPENIDVVVHPQSILHSMVEFVDKSMIAQASFPTMEIPIQYALTYPDRAPSARAPFDFLRSPVLEFSLPDRKKFPCLQLAYDALEGGGSMPCFLNAANEVLVNLFLNREIRWIDIPRSLERLMKSHTPSAVACLEDVLEVDSMARELANEVACSILY
jgi:1-deoxy-D-xylulose-5-phosphate reductoisomerase